MSGGARVRESFDKLSNKICQPISLGVSIEPSDRSSIEVHRFIDPLCYTLHGQVIVLPAVRPVRQQVMSSQNADKMAL